MRNENYRDSSLGESYHFFLCAIFFQNMVNSINLFFPVKPNRISMAVFQNSAPIFFFLKEERTNTIAWYFHRIFFTRKKNHGNFKEMMLSSFPFKKV